MAGAAALSGMAVLPGAAYGRAFAGGSDIIRVGLIGCGGRGRGAVRDAVRAAEGVEVHALGDLFVDHLAAARDGLLKDKSEPIRAACKFTDDTCFAGFDAYKRVVECDIDYVLIACPPYFHPAFIEAAIDAGKHVFCEKPGAIDMPGIHRLLAAGQKATSQGTGFLCGMQRRHQLSYLETIRRIHEGAIGRPIYGEAFWNNNEWIVVPREEGWSELEWQIRNWRQNRWLSGDAPGIILIHYIDTVMWAMQAQPTAALGTGGRQVYTDPELYGNIFDHFEARFTFGDDRRIHAMCRNWPGDARHSEYVLGTAGHAQLGRVVKTGDEMWGETYDWGKSNPGEEPSPYILEHRDMITSIRNGSPLNEMQALVDSSLAMIMMREAAYSGREVTREFLLKESKRGLGPDVAPDELEFGEREVEPVAVPGKYELG
jgi:predicted dehydrogenase